MLKTTSIRIKREQAKISQFKMAKALNITSQTLSKWELGKEHPGTSELAKLEEFFVNPQKFLSKSGVSLKKRTFSRSKSDDQDLTKSKISPELIEQFYKQHKPPRKPKSHNAKALMLFSGIGGMSQGFKEAGFEIVGHVEANSSAERIYELNFPGSTYIGNDVRKITVDDLSKLINECGEIDVIAGGPPCQGFSLAGKRNILDPRNELFVEFARIAKIVQPKVVLLENVKTLLSMRTKNGELVRDYLMSVFKDAGYTLSFASVNAADFGVPQSRQRVIFVGLRDDLVGTSNYVFPEPICGIEKDSLFKANVIPHVSFRAATADLESLESGESSSFDPWHFAVDHPEHVVEMLRGVPEGKSAHENTDPNLRPSSGYNTTYKRILWDEPASTISTNFGMISGSRNVHPSDTRSLTIREAMRCQTFPDYFKLEGSLGEIRKGIGNAVPPKLAQIFAESILEVCQEDRNTQPSD